MAKQPRISRAEGAANELAAQAVAAAAPANEAPAKAATASAVRTRRAYFDCRFGQLHVRTAFPTTGGFDEGVPLVCVHPSDGSSRTFTHFLTEIADDRSAYAPDLPGCGESDAPPGRPAAGAPSDADGVASVVDLAADLRLRQIDVLGFRSGAGVALELGATQPGLVRRLVLVAAAPTGSLLPDIHQETLVLRVKVGLDDSSQGPERLLLKATFSDLDNDTADIFDAAPKTLAKQISAFLRGSC